MRKQAIHFLLALLTLLWAGFRAEANVFASNVRVGAGTNNGCLVRGGSIGITYVLNEPASLGVAVQILFGTNVTRQFLFPAGEAGALRGSNGVMWDGLDFKGTPVPAGRYSIRVRACSAGYPDWTQISDDSNPGNQIFDPYGIAANQNRNSPYYGRIFVGNASSDFSHGPAGIFKFNADGSPADDGGFGYGGYQWSGQWYSPWKLAVSQEDRLLAEDLSGNGIAIGLDQTVSTNQIVVGVSNTPWANGASAILSGLAVSGAGDSACLFMCDANNLARWGQASLGILRWDLVGGAAASNDTGSVVVACGDGSDLNESAYDIDVDKNGALYAVQNIVDTGDASFRVMRFTLPSEGQPPATSADWKAGSSADLATNGNGDVYGLFDNLHGVAVDAGASNVAVAVLGASQQNGGLIVLDAATGAIKAVVDAGFDRSYLDVAWDAAGNLYGTQEEIWRAFSPPGANSSTTDAAIAIEVLDSLEPPRLSALQCAGSQFAFVLDGQPSVAYRIDFSVDLTNWTAADTNYSPSARRLISEPRLDSPLFFRAVIP